MCKKYELIDDKVEIDGHVLYRIRALKNFGDVRSGDIGGFIEHTRNLSHKGDCWIDDHAKVYEKARVCDDSHVYNNATVKGHARVCGNGQVYDNATLKGHARVCENGQVYDNATLKGNSVVYGFTEVYGSTKVR